MAYIHERNHGCRISADYTYRGLKTVIMENEKLRIGRDMPYSGSRVPICP